MAFIDLLAWQWQNGIFVIIAILRRFCNAFLLGFTFRMPKCARPCREYACRCTRVKARFDTRSQLANTLIQFSKNLLVARAMPAAYARRIGLLRLAQYDRSTGCGKIRDLAKIRRYSQHALTRWWQPPSNGLSRRKR